MAGLGGHVHLVALAATLLVETALVVGCVLVWRLPRSRFLRLGAVAAAINLVSHTLFWVALAVLPPAAFKILAMEVAVVLVEGLAYWRAGGLPLPRALTLSLLANGASYLAGGYVWPILW